MNREYDQPESLHVHANPEEQHEKTYIEVGDKDILSYDMNIVTEMIAANMNVDLETGEEYQMNKEQRAM